MHYSNLIDPAEVNPNVYLTNANDAYQAFKDQGYEGKIELRIIDFESGYSDIRWVCVKAKKTFVLPFIDDEAAEAQAQGGVKSYCAIDPQKDPLFVYRGAFYRAAMDEDYGLRVFQVAYIQNPAEAKAYLQRMNGAELEGEATLARNCAYDRDHTGAYLWGCSKAGGKGAIYCSIFPDEKVDGVKLGNLESPEENAGFKYKGHSFFYSSNGGRNVKLSLCQS